MDLRPKDENVVFLNESLRVIVLKTIFYVPGEGRRRTKLDFRGEWNYVLRTKI